MDPNLAPQASDFEQVRPVHQLEIFSRIFKKVLPARRNWLYLHINQTKTNIMKQYNQPILSTTHADLIECILNDQVENELI